MDLQAIENQYLTHKISIVFCLGFAPEGVKWEVLLGTIFGDGILNFLLVHACVSYFGSVFVLYLSVEIEVD